MGPGPPRAAGRFLWRTPPSRCLFRGTTVTGRRARAAVPRHGPPEKSRKPLAMNKHERMQAILLCCTRCQLADSDERVPADNSLVLQRDCCGSYHRARFTMHPSTIRRFIPRRFIPNQFIARVASYRVAAQLVAPHRVAQPDPGPPRTPTRRPTHAMRRICRAGCTLPGRDSDGEQPPPPAPGGRG